jgi:hypothetical protein
MVHFCGRDLRHSVLPWPISSTRQLAADLGIRADLSRFRLFVRLWKLVKETRHLAVQDS